jgi:DNA-directed RNA polymerase specialized sigma24 family protein
MNQSEPLEAAATGFSPRRPAPDADLQLVDSLKARNTAAWSDLYEAYHDKIYRFAWSHLRSQSEAEDLAAGVFDRALARIDSFTYNGTPLVAWLFGIARNLIRERRRRIARDGLQPVDEPWLSPDQAFHCKSMSPRR